MRNSMRRSGGKSSFCLAIARWMAIAQTSPSTALGNSISSPSPAVLAMRPRCSATSAWTIARHAVSPRNVASSSARISRLYSAMSAARIVVRRRSTCRGIRTISPGRVVDSDRPEMATDLPFPDSPPDTAYAGEIIPRHAPAPGSETARPRCERAPEIRKRTARQDNLAAHDQTFPIAVGAVYSLGATNAKDTAMTEFAYDHVHLRSPDPEETARYYQRMFGAE